MMQPSMAMVFKSVLKSTAFCVVLLCQVDWSLAQDSSQGSKLFEMTCTPCHNYEKGAQPDMYGQTLNLYGVVGRKAASVEGFQYSEDLRMSGIVWDEAKIDRFITAPKNMIPGTRMELPGVDDEKVRRDIVRFLGSLSQ
jgi:cytochrome c